AFHPIALELVADYFAHLFRRSRADAKRKDGWPRSGYACTKRACLHRCFFDPFKPRDEHRAQRFGDVVVQRPADQSVVRFHKTYHQPRNITPLPHGVAQGHRRLEYVARVFRLELELWMNERAVEVLRSRDACDVQWLVAPDQYKSSKQCRRYVVGASGTAGYALSLPSERQELIAIK